MAALKVILGTVAFIFSVFALMLAGGAALGTGVSIANGTTPQIGFAGLAAVFVASLFGSWCGISAVLWTLK